MIRGRVSRRLRVRLSIELLRNDASVRSVKVDLDTGFTGRGFNHYTSSIFTRRHSLEEESRILAALRDALLPKLVSGELRVTQLETASP